MKLWKIELTMKVSDSEYATDPAKWNWDDMVCTYDDEEVLEIKAECLNNGC